MAKAKTEKAEKTDKIERWKLVTDYVSAWEHRDYARMYKMLDAASRGRINLTRFTAAYEELLSKFGETTKRIVLVSPNPFGKGSARQPDLQRRQRPLCARPVGAAGAGEP